LAKFGTILDFQECTIQIDHAVVPMIPYKHLPVVVNERAELVSRPNFSTLRPKKVANDWEDAFIFASVKGFGLKLSIEGA
jgi:hypothetical protein